MHIKDHDAYLVEVPAKKYVKDKISNDENDTFHEGDSIRSE